MSDENISDQEVPESRAYRHIECNTETVVGDQSFSSVSNPMADVTRTWCTQCKSFSPMSDFVWADTEEKITDYYARHSANATDRQRFLCSKKFMMILWAIGFVLAAVGAFFLFLDQKMWVKVVFVPISGVIGIMIASAIFVSGIEGPITRKICGVKDTRMLK